MAAVSVKRSILNVQQQISPYPLVFLPAFLAFTSCILITAGLPRSGKIRKKNIFSRSGNLLKSQGKSLILSKSVKSQGILFSLRTKSREKSLKTKTAVLMVYQKSRSKCKRGFYYYYDYYYYYYYYHIIIIII